MPFVLSIGIYPLIRIKISSIWAESNQYIPTGVIYMTQFYSDIPFIPITYVHVNMPGVCLTKFCDQNIL